MDGLHGLSDGSGGADGSDSLDGSDGSDSFGDVRIGALLAMAQRVVFNYYSTALDHLHLTPGQAEILSLLSQGDAITSGVLAEMYRVKPPVMTAMVDDLVRFGLVKRSSDPNDRRRSVLMATEKGRQIMLELGAIRDHMQDLLTANLSKEEAAQLSISLKKVIRSVEGAKFNS